MWSGAAGQLTTVPGTELEHSMPAQSSNQPEVLELQEFKGLNQQSPRASIDDHDEWWNENLFAIGNGNLRSCWGPSAPIYQAPAGTQIVRIFFGFYGKNTPSFGSPPPGRMGWMFLTNGNIDEVDLDTGQVTTLPNVWLPVPPYYWASAKVWRPTWIGNTVGETGGVLFGSPLGLFAWDGTTLWTPGGPAPNWLTSADITGLGPFTMPVGLPGIYTMEVYQERLFVAGKNVISFSAPQNGADFSAFGGGGSFGYFGDKLVWSYMDLQASAGYLNVFGDSSTDVISNIQLTGQGTATSPFVTNFNYNNLDPQIGHGFPRPVGKWGRYFNTCNGLQLGAPSPTPTPVPDRGAIYYLEGGSYSMISEKVTNIWTTVDISQYYPTFAAATMFGFRVQLLNGRFTDPFGVTRSLLLMWHGSISGNPFWSIASQNLELTNIGTYEENSVLNPYGTDGTYLYRLFFQPDPALPKRLSTKAYRGTGNSSLMIKNFSRGFMELHDYSRQGVSFNGQLTTRGGGIPNGVQDVFFELTRGQQHDIIGCPLAGNGLSGEFDLLSYSPDFTIERVQAMVEEVTLFGA
jgi:hypothetical protein